MFTLVSLVVCLSSNPVLCETVTPDYVRQDGAMPTLFECLGQGGQEIAHKWLGEHPSYTLRRVQCSMANNPQKLRVTVASPEA